MIISPPRLTWLIVLGLAGYLAGVPPAYRAAETAALLNRHRRLSLGIEEWHLHNLGRHCLPDSFDGDFHLQFGAEL